jgi:hypothetical protein
MIVQLLAKKFTEENGMTFIPSFEDYRIIEGQGTVGAEILEQLLGSTDDNTRFEYMQKTNKETGPALVGIELHSKHDYEELFVRMRKYNIDFTELNKDDTLFGYLV